MGNDSRQPLSLNKPRQGRPNGGHHNHNKRKPNPGSHDSRLAQWLKDKKEIALLCSGPGAIVGKLTGFDAYSVTVTMPNIKDPIIVFKHSIDMMTTKEGYEAMQSQDSGKSGE